ncbi:uncharacterized protein LOC121872120 [Homarus americanus]|uniref:Uncharacterized protein n=1 Tax=Homarus americanus TaxID=6706 RepID=A0A8J5JXE0_HOMAM|nr:uncharacterized protein LOC121872120 [Homarus americanus]KAG7164096.1 hypothetical protein Hamer_G023924 [Homarus americanus]
MRRPGQCLTELMPLTSAEWTKHLEVNSKKEDKNVKRIFKQPSYLIVKFIARILKFSRGRTLTQKYRSSTTTQQLLYNREHPEGDTLSLIESPVPNDITTFGRLPKQSDWDPAFTVPRDIADCKFITKLNPMTTFSEIVNRH